MFRYLLKFYMVLALAYGVQGDSNILVDNYVTIIIVFVSLMVVGLLMYLAACCMEGVLEFFRVTLLCCLRCCLFCRLCCLYCSNDEKGDITSNIVTETERQPPTINQPTATTIINIGGAQPTQPNELTLAMAQQYKYQHQGYADQHYGYANAMGTYRK